MTQQSTAGTKADTGKPLWGLCPFEIIGMVAGSRFIAGRGVQAIDLGKSVQLWMRRDPKAIPIGITLQHAYPVALPIWNDVIKVLEFGAKKYAPFNWETGIAYSRVYHAFCRHWKAILVDGELTDPETGLPHEAHALCELMFLAVFEARGMHQFDDRPNKAITQEASARVADACKKAVDLAQTDHRGPGRSPAPSVPDQAHCNDTSGRLYVWGPGGQRIYLEPRDVSELPSWEVIANSLDGQTRWTGHAGRKWSTAAHALAVSRVAQRLAARMGFLTGAIFAVSLAALHHDDHEVITGDINSNMKKALKRAGCHEVKRLSDNFDHLLSARLGLEAFWGNEIVDRADKAVGEAEAQILPLRVPADVAQKFCNTDPEVLDIAKNVVTHLWNTVQRYDNAAEVYITRHDYLTHWFNVTTTRPKSTLRGTTT